MLKNKLIDGIIKEPLGGAHADPEKMYKKLKTDLKKNLNRLTEVPVDELVEQRIDKFCNMGVYKESTAKEATAEKA